MLKEKVAHCNIATVGSECKVFNDISSLEITFLMKKKKKQKSFEILLKPQSGPADLILLDWKLTQSISSLL